MAVGTQHLQATLSLAGTQMFGTEPLWTEQITAAAALILWIFFLPSLTMRQIKSQLRTALFHPHSTHQ